MLNKIIQFSLRNRMVVLVASLLLMVAGTYTAVNMEVDVFPDLTAPTVVIMTEAKGMAPEEVEQLVTFAVETAVNGATDVRRVRSSSTTGFSIVWVEFNWGTDIYRARQIVSEKLAVVKETLPANAGNPTIGPQSSILGELMIIGMTADSTSMQELRTLADRTVRPRLLSTGGVAQVTVLGGDIKEYQILLNPDRMKRYNVGLDEVIKSVADMNRNASGGVLYEYGNEYIIRGLLSVNDRAALGQTVVKRADGGGAPVMLEHIAQVGIGHKTPKSGVASEKGKPAVLITVTKQPAVSTLALTEKIDRSLAELQAAFPADVRTSSDIFRQARFIDHAIDNVQKSLYEGGLFVVVVLFLFLMNARTTVISLVTIPLSLVASIVALKLMGLTINTMSLGGMAIAIGSLVDDAIVDVENVFKRLRENRQRPEDERQPALTVVFEASKEVRMPILNATLIIIAGFVPLFFLSGMEGRMLAPLGIAFIVALAASTVVALTLTPVLCSYLLKTSVERRLREPFVSRKIKSGYSRALRRALRHRRWVLGGTGVATVAAIVIFLTLGRSFLPPFNEGSFTVNISTLPGISLEESDKMGRMAETILLSIPEIQTTGRKTGRAELDEHALGVNVSEIEAPFVLDKRSKEAVQADIRERLRALPGVNVEIGQPISHRIDAMLSGTRANIAIKLFGNDLNKMFTIGNQIKAAIADVEGIADLNVEQQVERPQLKIIPKREMMARVGMTPPELAEIITVMLAGDVVSQVYEGNKAFDLTLKVDDDSRQSAERIRQMAVDAGGRKIPLGYLVDVISSTGPNTINRENIARKIVISANVAGRDLRSTVNDVRRKIDADIPLPEGYRIEYGGQFESEQTASRTLLITSLFAIIVIFLLLFNQFRSVAQSTVILLNLPLALIGGVFALFFTGGVISIPAIIGFISLFGIATRNGMLLLSRYNDLRHEGLSARDSVLHGSLDRLNPILMTALSSGLALIPLALGGDLPGNEIQSPMAKVILGGLLTSTLLNGFIIPIMYLITTHNE
ncbi:MAG: CusA/CzcA family heavy metal efflux RND transporter [Prevotellaceae bacterium]|jgi:Cu(I)/Ag(I) efflux system membrane protein CusA/SilA|nr:CusA/CzcA family heavy metal efflux RND transporter [Prevotellaceae bacterium]